MKFYSTNKIKIILLLFCVLSIFLFTYWREKVELRYFLGMKEISLKERDSIINSREAGQLSEEIFFNKQKIVKDSSQTFYLPLSLENKWEHGKVTTADNRNKICVVMEENRKEKNDYQATGDKLSLLIYNDEVYQEVFLIITAFPVMSVNFAQTPKEIILEENEYFCEFDFYSAKNEGEQPIQAVNDYCRIHKRGGSTKDFEKCGLKVELVDEKGVKIKRNLCNLRDDDDWILIPMYVEESKIRDKFCIDLWRAMSGSETEKNAGTQMEYVEFILNGNYYGLYGLAVPVDQKQLDLKENGEDSDLLFRLDGLFGVDLNALSEAGELTEAGNVSVKFPKEMEQEKWNVIKDFLTLVYYEDDEVFADKIQSMVDWENMADVYLFLNVIYGKDNTLKNMYYCMRLQEDGTYKVSMIPWDMDLSLGTYYDTENKNGLYWEYDTEENLMKKECACRLTKRLRQLNVRNFEGLLKEKYQIYRKSILSKKSLFKRIEELSDKIHFSGAYARDEMAWPDGGHSADDSKMKEALQGRLIYLSNLEATVQP